MGCQTNCSAEALVDPDSQMEAPTDREGLCVITNHCEKIAYQVSLACVFLLALFSLFVSTVFMLPLQLSSKYLINNPIPQHHHCLFLSTFNSFSIYACDRFSNTNMEKAKQHLLFGNFGRRVVSIAYQVEMDTPSLCS